LKLRWQRLRNCGIVPGEPAGTMTREVTMQRRDFLQAGLFGAAGLGVLGMAGFSFGGASARPKGKFEITKSDAEWKKQLSADQYYVLRQEGTERPYTSPLNKEKRAGTFICAGCQLPLFSSKTKFESGTGWPSFYAPLAKAVGTSTDTLLGYPRTEVHCRRCGGHLGHVFEDGPKPTGLRYCMNGDAMLFRVS
jgi:peptide-methionine (R)-S-oxide reductase